MGETGPVLMTHRSLLRCLADVVRRWSDQMVLEFPNG